MPIASNFLNPASSEANSTLNKILLYGVPKSKKTWWTGLIAGLGYNVHYFDIERGLVILKNIPADYLPKINIIDIADINSTPIALSFIDRFLQAKTTPFYYNEITKRESKDGILIQPGKLTSSDVIVIDSYTALVDSVISGYKVATNKNMSSPDDFDWDFYNWAQTALNDLIRNFMALPCHVIFIAHEQKTDVIKNKKVTGFEISIVSSSFKHSKSLARFFSDILYFSVEAPADIYISTALANNRLGGSRVRKPDKQKWENFPPSNIFPTIQYTPSEFITFPKTESNSLEDKPEALQQPDKSSIPPLSKTGEKTNAFGFRQK